jgi:uncharacterized membrane protein YeaQ/YmgE (transglycosylase-associated protein family)
MEHGLVAWLIIGAIAGWLAGVLVKGGGFGGFVALRLLSRTKTI